MESGTGFPVSRFHLKVIPVTTVKDVRSSYSSVLGVGYD